MPILIGHYKKLDHILLEFERTLFLHQIINSSLADDCLIIINLLLFHRTLNRITHRSNHTIASCCLVCTVAC